MELKPFVKTVLHAAIAAVEEVEKESGKEVHIATQENNECVRFDIAVTAENTTKGNLEGGVKVWGFNFGGDSAQEAKSSNVSRISFGVYVSSSSKKEIEAQREKIRKGIYR